MAVSSVSAVYRGQRLHQLSAEIYWSVVICWKNRQQIVLSHQRVNEHKENDFKACRDSGPLQLYTVFPSFSKDLMHDVSQYIKGLFLVVVQASVVMLLPPLPHLLNKDPWKLKAKLRASCLLQVLFFTIVATVYHRKVSHTNINFYFYLPLVALAIFLVYQNQHDSSPRIYKDEDSLMMVHSPLSPQATPWSSLQRHFVGFRHTN